MSKELEALNVLVNMAVVQRRAYELKPIIEKSLKALEIIKKRFTIQFLKSDFPNYYGIMQIGTNPIYIKTKEEFYLLKEVLL